MINEKPVNSATSKESAPTGIRTILSRKVLFDSVVRLNPKSLLKNPVMLIVELTFFIVAAMAIVPQAFVPISSPSLQGFYIEVAIILIIYLLLGVILHMQKADERQVDGIAPALRSLDTPV